MDLRKEAVDGLVGPEAVNSQRHLVGAVRKFFVSPAESDGECKYTPHTHTHGGYLSSWFPL